MQLTGKFNLFNRTRTVKKGGKEYTFKDFSTTISQKDKDGNYDNAYLEVVFANKEKFSNEVQMKFKENYFYTVDVTDGWLGFRKYKSKDDKTITILQLVIHDGKILKYDRVEKAKEAQVQSVEDKDLPF